ncbi:MAG TPA: hypothetical protein PK910_09465 [Bacteroidales bacterium]|nr:hypothetical protein [Bacteroidales bacterium]HRC90229.1 hypothetical protein [Bacteroidales bacterium]
MKNKVIGIFAFAVIMAFIIPASVKGQAKPNFSGTWAYNASKSDQPQGQGGGQRAFGGGDFVVKQDANTLTVERTRTTQDGQSVTTTTKYTLDGKETVNTAPGGRGGESKSTATWSPDGKSLTIVTTRTFNDMTMTTKEVWTLTDARTLTITSTSDTPNGQITIKRVYDKKQ